MLGFTIVELVVVIVVLGILASVTLLAFNGISSRARDANRQSQVRSMQAAIDAYRIDYGIYPQGISGGIPNTDHLGYSAQTLSLPLQEYLSSIPSEPSAPARNYQYVRDDPNSYGILIHWDTRPTCHVGVNQNPPDSQNPHLSW